MIAVDDWRDDLLRAMEIAARIEDRLEALKNTRDAAKRIGNEKLFVEASLWIPPLMRIRESLYRIADQLEKGLKVPASIEACKLSKSIRVLLNDVRKSSLNPVISPLEADLREAYRFLAALCISS
ncbi:MAG: hypothetical protein F7C35_02355 [Desulfurococcales archaeon]|nr:hypothetical protein [Desulfurococcales archaeon]